MNEKIKTDYLKFIFQKTNVDLARYNINAADRELVNKLFGRIITSDNLLRDLYILSQIKEFRNIGKYFIFILKKIEDKVINYDNLLQNLNSDVEFIENEILNYLSNPKLRDIIELKYRNESSEAYININDSSETVQNFDEPKIQSENYEDDSEDETDVTNFKDNYLDKKNYLELIQSDEDNNENFYELPETDVKKNSDEPGMAFELPDKESGKEEELILKNDFNSGVIIEEAVEGAAEETIEETKNKLIEEKQTNEETDKENLATIIEQEPDSSFIIKGKLISPEEENEEAAALFNQTLFDEQDEQKDRAETGDDNDKEFTESTDAKNSETEKIQLSDEIREEIETFKEEQKYSTEEENIFDEEEEIIEEQPANALFLEYENQVKDQNVYLNNQFDMMINILEDKPSDEEKRNEIIKNILEASIHLEKISREISLEIISNIYQTITLSFEKISEGKYDISQSTLNLFKNGLSLVISLIRGDDYFGYKDILKLIENIRNSLIEERQKREQFLKLKQEKIELERNLSQKYPDDSQRKKITLIKKLVKDTEVKFNFLEKITGEYQIYEALRSLSGNLTNFKEIVKISKELEMKKLVQLAEASYIFLKFLQNYRINPVTQEIKEIFGYIIYNLKSLVMGKEIKDIDLFISYLNDPVKIFSK